MPWAKTAADRQRDQQTYGSAEYRRNRALALQRDGGRCVQCGSRQQVQVDHIVPVSQVPDHSLGNLRTLCGACHKAKTATEGGGYRANRRQGDPKPKPGTKW